MALGKTLASRAKDCIMVSKWAEDTGKIGEPGSCLPAEPWPLWVHVWGNPPSRTAAGPETEGRMSCTSLPGTTAASGAPQTGPNRQKVRSSLEQPSLLSVLLLHHVELLWLCLHHIGVWRLHLTCSSSVLFTSWLALWLSPGANQLTLQGGKLTPQSESWSHRSSTLTGSVAVLGCWSSKAQSENSCQKAHGHSSEKHNEEFCPFSSLDGFPFYAFFPGTLAEAKESDRA